MRCFRSTLAAFLFWILTLPSVVSAMNCFETLEQAEACLARNDETTAFAIFLSLLTNHPGCESEYILRRLDELWLDSAQRATLTDVLISCAQLLPPFERRLALDLYATLCRSLGNTQAADRTFLSLAPITNWLIVGGFDNAQRAGLVSSFSPETSLATTETYPGKQWPVCWRSALPLRPSYSVDLQLVRPAAWLTVYLRTGLFAPQPTNTLLIIEFPGAFRLWLNGLPLAEEDEYREAHSEMYFIPLTLNPGTNFLVAKLCAVNNKVSFLARLALPDGTPLFLPNFQPDDTTVPLTCASTSSWPRACHSPGTRRWETTYTIDSNNFAAASKLARYYALTRRDEQAVALYQSLLTSTNLPAADIINLARCHLRKKSQSQAAALFRKALELDQRASAARTALGRHYLDRGMFDLALPMLQEALTIGTNDLEARLSLVALYRARNWSEDALRLARETVVLFPLNDRAHRAVAQVAADASFDHLTEASYLAALACRPSNLAEREAIVRLYQRLRRFDEAAHHIEAIQNFHPHEPSAWLLRIRNAFLQRDATSGISTCQAALKYFPDHATFYQRLGDFYNMLGQREEAVAAYRACLTYEPNRLWLRRYLDFITEKSDVFFRKYDIGENDAKELASSALQSPLPGGERLFSVITRRILVQLYQDGSSRQQFHLMLRVLSPRGVQQASSVSLPPCELIRAVTYKPDGRVLDATHLDAGQVEFPEVQVGDVIEYKYRVDRYGGSWLDQHFFSVFAFDLSQGDVQHAELVLAIPTNRTLTWVTRPRLFRPRRAHFDSYVTYRWSLRNIPMLPAEPSAPPYLDLARAIAVSTIPSWDLIADWQRGMLSDVTCANAEVQRLAHDLTRSATSDVERVASLFTFITANFRYTRMYETPIASIKPHPIPDILANRCGDCKDLSLLLIELLKACNITAFPALIRTTDTGSLLTNVPSPDLFNHMIVYLPYFRGGTFLDPTFRLGEWDLLPASCHDAWAFIVTDTSYQFLRTPLAPPRDSRSELAISGVITPDGACTGVMTLTLHRLDAADGRALLERLDDHRKIGSFYVARIEPNARLTSFAACNSAPTNLPLLFHIGFSAPRFAQPASALLSFSLPWPLAPEDIHAGLERRSHPLRFETLNEEAREYVLHLPQGAHCSLAITNLAIRSRFGSFSFSAEQRGSLFHASWLLTLTRREISSAAYPAFRRFLSRCAEATSQLIIIRLPSSTLAPTNSFVNSAQDVEDCQ